MLPGRTANSIKNHWNSTLMRKLERQNLFSKTFVQPFFPQTQFQFQQVTFSTTKDEHKKRTWSQTDPINQTKCSDNYTKKHKQNEEALTAQVNTLMAETSHVSCEQHLDLSSLFNNHVNYDCGITLYDHFDIENEYISPKSNKVNHILFSDHV
jgi:hypothetical protein